MRVTGVVCSYIGSDSSYVNGVTGIVGVGAGGVDTDTRHI